MADKLRAGKESLDAVAVELARGGLANRASHDSKVRNWCAVGRRAAVEPFPLTKVAAGVILRCLQEGGYRSPEQYLSAARRHHTESRHGAVAADAELAIKDMLRNVTRNLGDPERSDPVEVEHLIALRQRGEEKGGNARLRSLQVAVGMWWLLRFDELSSRIVENFVIDDGTREVALELSIAKNNQRGLMCTRSTGVHAGVQGAAR